MQLTAHISRSEDQWAGNELCLRSIEGLVHELRRVYCRDSKESEGTLTSGGVWVTGMGERTAGSLVSISPGVQRGRQVHQGGRGGWLRKWRRLRQLVLGGDLMGILTRMPWGVGVGPTPMCQRPRIILGSSLWWLSEVITFLFQLVV